MIDQRAIVNAIIDFCGEKSEENRKNGWRKFFENAPAGAKERIAISFYFSKYHKEFTPKDSMEYRKVRDEVDGNLTQADLEYLIKYSKKESIKKYYQGLLEDFKLKTANVTYGSVRGREAEQARGGGIQPPQQEAQVQPHQQETPPPQAQQPQSPSVDVERKAVIEEVTQQV